VSPKRQPRKIEIPPKTRAIVDQLKEWCEAEYGRKSEVARAIGTKPQVITNWFGNWQGPTAEQILTVIDFLKNQERPKRRKAKEG
jgi:hypothetical protein